MRCYNNTSLRGAVHYHQSPNNKIKNAIFSFNKANGAIFVYESELDIENCQVLNTIAPASLTASYGFGIGIQGSNCSITNSIITGIKRGEK